MSSLFVGLAETINEIGPALVENRKYLTRPTSTPLHHALTAVTDVKDIFEMVGLVLEQKAVCQVDPDQEEDEEPPEDQAEEDSMLITAASDVVAALATALGSDFTEPFKTFFPMIAKYYVSVSVCVLCGGVSLIWGVCVCVCVG